MLKSMPASVGDMGWVPDPGRPHMPGAAKPVWHSYKAVR